MSQEQSATSETPATVFVTPANTDVLSNSLRFVHNAKSQTTDRLVYWLRLLSSIYSNTTIGTYTEVVTGQIRHEQAAYVDYHQQLLLWFKYKEEVDRQHGDELRELDEFRTRAESEFTHFNFQEQVHKDRLDDHRTDINELWTSIYLLQGITQAQQEQLATQGQLISTLQQELVIAQTTATRALKRAKHGVSSRHSSPRAGPSR